MTSRSFLHLSIFLLLILILLLTVPSEGQSTVVVGNVADAFNDAPIVARLPAAATARNQIRVVSDGTSSSDCTVGGAATWVVCISNGTAWVSLGSGGGGGSTPTGTGFVHVTGGVQDGASKTVDVSSADITGVLKAASFPVLSGDLTTPGGSLTTTLANSGVSAGSCGDSTHACTLTFDAKGRATVMGNANISGAGAPAAGSTFFSTTTLTGPSNTNAETSLLSASGINGSKTIPANTFSNGVVLEGETTGFYSSPVSPDNLTLKLKCGSTVLGSKTISGLVGLASNQAFRLFYYIHSIGNGAGGAFLVNTIAEFTSTTLAAPNEAAIVNTSSVAYDFTTSCAFDVTATWAAATVGESISAVGAVWIPGAPILPMAVANGGTGNVSLTAYAPLFGGTTSTGNVQSGTVGSTNQLLKSNGAGALPTFQDPPKLILKDWPAAAGQNGSFSLSGNCGATCPTPAAPPSSANVNQGTANFTNASVNALEYHFIIPTGWTASMGITVSLTWLTSIGDNTKNGIWNVALSCPSAGASIDAAYNTAGTVTTAANASANVSITSTINLTSGASNLTNCAAGGLAYVKVSRPTGGSDNIAASMNLIEIVITNTNIS